MTTGSAIRKHKRVVLSIEDKTEVIDMLDHGSSSKAIVAKYGIAKSTVSDIKINKAKILAFKREMADMGMNVKAKTVRLGDNYHYNHIIASEASFLYSAFNDPDFRYNNYTCSYNNYASGRTSCCKCSKINISTCI